MQKAIKLLRCARQFQPDTGDRSQARNLRIPSAVQCQAQAVSLWRGRVRATLYFLYLPDMVEGGEGENTPARFAVRSLLGFLFMAR